jgi:hypothetical protein
MQRPVILKVTVVDIVELDTDFDSNQTGAAMRGVKTTGQEMGKFAL